MKFCTKCGNELLDEAVMCPRCGSATEAATPVMVNNNNASGLQTAAKIFMIIGCVSAAFMYLIPLLWAIPMTIHYCNAIKNRQPVGTGFKVCTLLFVSLVAGILMFCDSSNNNNQ